MTSQEADKVVDFSGEQVRTFRTEWHIQPDEWGFYRAAFRAFVLRKVLVLVPPKEDGKLK